MKKRQIVFLVLLLLLCFSFNFTYASNSNLHYANQTFSFSISEEVGFHLYAKEFTNTDNSIALVDKKGQFTVLITSDLINDEALSNMRQILGDNMSSDQKIFSKIYKYKLSYFKAMVEHNKNDFYFSNPATPSPETYIKIFREYDQILFEENSNVILFNTIEASNQSVSEETSINMTIPSYSNMTIYSINITGNKGFLTKDNISRISLLIEGLSIPNSKSTNNSLDIFLDTKIINRANQGIYPDLTDVNVEFVQYVNEKHNYKIYHPSTFIPYLKNSMVSSFDYVSFKIDYNNHYSISVENLVSPNTYVMDKKEQLKALYNNELTILDFGKTNNLNKNYDFLKYKIEKDYGPLYVTEVYIFHKSKLFTISLNSYLKEPSTTILNIFNQIISSLEFTKSYTIDDFNKNIIFTQFANDLMEYSFVYPDNWSITNKLETVNSSTFRVSSPEYSTSVDILISESTTAPTILKETLFKFTLQNANSSTNNSLNHNAPYAMTTHKILNTKLEKKGDVLYIYKLINFLDERDRYRLAYSIDIIHDHKIYSLFISINDFLASGTDFTDEKLMYIIDTITDSFDIQNNIMYLGHTDQRAGLTKDHFRKVLCVNALITRPTILNSKSDILIYPSVFMFAHKPTMFSDILREFDFSIP